MLRRVVNKISEGSLYHSIRRIRSSANHALYRYHAEDNEKENMKIICKGLTISSNGTNDERSHNSMKKILLELDGLKKDNKLSINEEYYSAGLYHKYHEHYLNAAVFFESAYIESNRDLIALKYCIEMYSYSDGVELALSSALRSIHTTSPDNRYKQIYSNYIGILTDSYFQCRQYFETEQLIDTIYTNSKPLTESALLTMMRLSHIKGEPLVGIEEYNRFDYSILMDADFNDELDYLLASLYLRVATTDSLRKAVVTINKMSSRLQFYDEKRLLNVVCLIFQLSLQMRYFGLQSVLHANISDILESLFNHIEESVTTIDSSVLSTLLQVLSSPDFNERMSQNNNSDDNKSNTSAKKSQLIVKDFTTKKTKGLFSSKVSTPPKIDCPHLSQIDPLSSVVTIKNGDNRQQELYLKFETKFGRYFRNDKTSLDGKDMMSLWENLQCINLKEENRLVIELILVDESIMNGNIKEARILLLERSSRLPGFEPIGERMLTLVNAHCGDVAVTRRLNERSGEYQDQQVT